MSAPPSSSNSSAAAPDRDSLLIGSAALGPRLPLGRASPQSSHLPEYHFRTTRPCTYPQLRLGDSRVIPI